MAGLDSTADHLQDPAAEIEALRARVAEADLAYHRDDAPIISDANRMLSVGMTWVSRSTPGWW